MKYKIWLIELTHDGFEILRKISIKLGPLKYH